MKSIKTLLALSTTLSMSACGKNKVSALGDTVVIDFEGTVNGIKFKGGNGSNYKLVLGSKSFIGDFEEQLVGYTEGEYVEVKVTFPDDYYAKHLAGHSAKFETKIKIIIKEK